MGNKVAASRFMVNWSVRSGRNVDLYIIEVNIEEVLLSFISSIRCLKLFMHFVVGIILSF